MVNTGQVPPPRHLPIATPSPTSAPKKTHTRYVLCTILLSRRYEIKPETPQKTPGPVNDQIQMAIPLPTNFFDSGCFVG